MKNQATVLIEDKVVIDKLDAYLMISRSKGKFFSAQFIKGDGEVRDMLCRLGVKKDLTGKGLRYDPASRSMVCVYDIRKKGYRMLNLQKLEWLTIGGGTYRVI